MYVAKKEIEYIVPKPKDNVLFFVVLLCMMIIICFFFLAISTGVFFFLDGFFDEPVSRGDVDGFLDLFPVQASVLEFGFRLFDDVVREALEEVAHFPRVESRAHFRCHLQHAAFGDEGVDEVVDLGKNFDLRPYLGVFRVRRAFGFEEKNSL